MGRAWLNSNYSIISRMLAMRSLHHHAPRQMNVTERSRDSSVFFRASSGLMTMVKNCHDTSSGRGREISEPVISSIALTTPYFHILQMF